MHRGDQALVLLQLTKHDDVASREPGYCKTSQPIIPLVLQVEAVLLFQNWRMGSDSITFGSVEARPAMEAAAAGMSKKEVATADWGQSTRRVCSLACAVVGDGSCASL